MSDKLCPICFDVIEEEANEYKLDCTHFFHDKCIINWFRSENSNGKCPCCNDSPQNSIESPSNNTYYYGNNMIEQRCSAIRRFSNRKTAPKPLKKRVEKLRNLENDLKNISKQRTDHKKDNKEILKKHLGIWNSKERFEF